MSVGARWIVVLTNAAAWVRPWHELGMELVYDVAHNIAKPEEHDIDGLRKHVWVHRGSDPFSDRLSDPSA